MLEESRFRAFRLVLLVLLWLSYFLSDGIVLLTFVLSARWKQVQKREQQNCELR